MDNDKERDSFRAAMSDIKPLRSDRTAPVTQKPPPVARFTRQDQQEVLEESLVDQSRIIENGDEILFCRLGSAHPIVKKLKRARYSIDEEIDLHGLNAREAKGALYEFIKEAQYRRWSCLRIIHGKGNRSFQGVAVLRPKVAKWLRQNEAVIAYSSALPKDGGTGALYVLIAI